MAMSPSFTWTKVRKLPSDFDKVCKRTFKKKIVVGKQADDGNGEKEGEKG